MSRTILFLFVLSSLLLAHHGGAEYDLGKTVEFKAKLTKVDLINPHAWLYFDVTESDGKVSHHRCEMRSVHVLRRSGWTKELFPVGQQITIEASPNRTDPASCYLQTILTADGTRMDRYGQYIKGSQGLQEVRGPIVAPKNNRPPRRSTGEPNLAGDWAPIQQVMVNPRGTGGGLVSLNTLDQYKSGERPANVGAGKGKGGAAPKRASALWRDRTDRGRRKSGRGFQARRHPAFPLRDDQRPV